MRKDMSNALDLHTQDLVAVILRRYTQLSEEEISAWTQMILDHTLLSLRSLHALEKQCAAACEAKLTGNPSRDLSDIEAVLREAMDKHDAYIAEHGHPMNKNHRSEEELSFWAEMHLLRTEMDADRLMQLPSSRLKELAAVLTARCALYDLFEKGCADTPEIPQDTDPAILQEQLRDCACSIAIWLGQNSSFDLSDAQMLTIKACTLYRLGYLDEYEIEETASAFAHLLDQEAAAQAAQEPEPAQTQEITQRRAKKHVLPLCAAGALSWTALAVLAPRGITATLTALILLYMIFYDPV